MASNDVEEHHETIIITTGSRLHAGFYSIGGTPPWATAGFYVEYPSFKARVRKCSKLEVSGASESLDAIKAAAASLGLNACIEIHEEIPRHTGLGSTTQVTLAIGCAAMLLSGRRCDPIRLAVRLGRGRYSGAGTLAFKYGGFVADSGVPDKRGPKLLIRLKLPVNWRFVIVVPEARRGLSEDEEKEVLLATPPTREQERLMSKGLLQLAMSIRRADLHGAIDGLRAMQTGTGMYFRRVQGGIYREDISMIAAEASRYGIYLAQSSWGPTLYTLTTAEDAGGDARILESILRDVGLRGRVIVTKPRNRGADATF